LNIRGGLDTPTARAVTYREHNLTDASDEQLTRYRREHVGFVFRCHNLIPSLTARENVALVTELSDDPLALDEALELVGLGARAERFHSEMSGKEQQRVAVVEGEREAVPLTKPPPWMKTITGLLPSVEARGVQTLSERQSSLVA
jgi:ABC-type lipoprotein export system ATPase subunit